MTPSSLALILRVQPSLPAILLTLAMIAGCGGDRGKTPVPSQAVASGPSPEWFTDRAKDTGLDFVHVNGMSGQFYMSEILAPGVALFDYDNDGDLDVYLVQGRMLASGHASAGPLSDRLYRNDLQVHADGSLRFTDVTKDSKIVARGYGMGVATGDFNNDGWTDLYLTKFDAPNQLLRNNGDGTFADVSRESGTENSGWSVSAAFVDYDRDGWLDLYVGNYLRYSIETNAKCFSASGMLDYCTPNSFQPLPDRLFHNNRDGTFRDVTAQAGIAREFGPALGVITADFDGDGWIDIYVANDSQENQLWLNQRNGTLKNTALLSGAALTAEGKAESSMGVDAGDFDADGDDDLVITEQTGEGHNLFVNDGAGTFEDRGTRSGLGPVSLAYTGFGTAWFDFDNDGWLDLLTVNGAIQTIQSLAQARDPFPLHQRKQLLRNLHDGTFEDVSGQAGPVFQLSEVGRGAAFGDIDNDGDTDVLVGNNNGSTRLLINNIGNRKHWLGLRLVSGSTSLTANPERVERVSNRASRDMLGTRVEIHLANRAALVRRARADGSYASANDPRVLVGLGDSADAPTVRVRWPSGRVEDFGSVAIDRYSALKEGAGK